MKKFWSIVILLLLLTRFVGLDWGLPYPMHPDERNMVMAMDRLSCDVSLGDVFEKGLLESARNCLNPEFYAYGQPPLYLGHAIRPIVQLATQNTLSPFSEGSLSLRIISATSSVLTGLLLLLLIKKFFRELWKSRFLRWSSALVIIFSPYFIQFSHFGTTESLLMLVMVTLVYASLSILCEKKPLRWILISAIVVGFGVAVKVSAGLFMLVPLGAIIYKFVLSSSSLTLREKIRWTVRSGLIMGLGSLLIAVVFSPHFALSLKDVIRSLTYEIAVGNGATRVFYTRSFEYSQPVVFHFSKIFPYALGIVQLMLFGIGFLYLSWRSTKINFLRFSALVFFVPTAILYAKWTRFSSPVFPIMTLFSLLMIADIYRRRHLRKFLSLIVFLAIIPGVAYLSIYASEDVRFTASKWIYENVPPESHILSETANVIDVPILPPDYDVSQVPRYIYSSFDFYNLDSNPALQPQLDLLLTTADYILVPSRRVYANHTCYDLFNSGSRDQKLYELGFSSDKCDGDLEYPLIDKYYYDQITGPDAYFEKIAHFSSYPRITLAGKTIFSLADEHAEETWTVFDHPVISVYKRVKE